MDRKPHDGGAYNNTLPAHIEAEIRQQFGKCPTPEGCGKHGCHGACLPEDEPSGRIPPGATHMTQEPELLPCPFCGAGITSVRENGKVWNGQRYSEPSSVSIWHHCEPIAGQPNRGIERVGRDLASAVAAWNMRSMAKESAT